ncbi:MAG: sulfotransferase [Bacteriovorax sp.]|nr:sulfotransferase [Bacteriovorax sp.]
MILDPIFIIGTERSGSNLLRLLLNSHPNIAIPHPPHIMNDFSSLLPGYGDLALDENFLKLTTDVTNVVENHFSPWPIKVSPQLINKLAPSKTLYGIYAAMYESYRLHENKLRWGCKSTFMFSEIENILKHHSSPRFIHLVRDPRDIAVSASKSIFSKYHPYKMAELWKEEQEQIEKWNYLKPEGKLLTIYYEDLTTNPTSVMKTLMGFLNEEFFPEQLNFFKDKEAKRLASLSQSWKKVEDPINTKSVGQYKDKMTNEEIEMIEYHCQDLMKKYSYPLISDTARLKKPANYKIFKIELMEQFTKWKTEFQSMYSDKNFYLRWKKKYLLKKIKWQQHLHY